ncbi:MAG: hypothetical protein JSV23_08670 [Promethearchaeota archaeon]|nr:MAG: hypothetical protein JSV23_08670 [Candidatus Lokiarchaeota archaeon]
MIRSTKIILIIAAAIVLGGASIFGIIVFVNWGTFEYSNTYYYQGVPSPVEILSLNSDIGAININYNSTPTDYIVKVDLDIRIDGGFVAGKAYSDFFEDVVWLNGSIPITFELVKKVFTGFIFPIIYDIEIDVTLRTDIIYDITAVSSTGAINMVVPQNIVLNNTNIATSTGLIFLNAGKNTTVQGILGMSTSTGAIEFFANQINLTHGLNTHTSTGSLTLNFTSCITGDNIYIDDSTGSIILNSYNMKYTKDTNWYISTATGSIYANFKQFVEMNANITGTIQSSTGSIDIIYDDSLSSIGAKFTCTVGTGSITYTDLGAGGMSRVNGIISTNDYDSATNKFTFTVSTSTGSIDVVGQSL